MADLFDLYETSTDLENDGIWLNFGPSKVLVARNGGGNIEWIKQYSEEITKLGKVGTKQLDWIEELKLTKRIFCKSVVKGHKVKNDDGEFVDGILLKKDGEKVIVDFNHDNLMEMFEQLPEYFLDIKKFADDYKTFLSSQVEKQEKN